MCYLPFAKLEQTSQEKEGINMIGQSEVTPWKELGFQCLMQGIIVKSKIMIDSFGGRATFHCYDLYAGTGVNDWGDGSAKIMSNTVSCDTYGLGSRVVNMVFTEKDKKHYKKLVENTKHIRANKLNCDCKTALTDIKRTIEVDYMEDPKKAVGVILLDPNGLVKANQYKTLRLVAEECPYLVIIINYNITALQRCQGVKKIKSFEDFNNRSVENTKTDLKRNHCYIRDIVASNHTKWTMLALSNFYISGIKEAGFCIDTRFKGKNISRQVDRLPHQKHLFW